MGPHLSLQGSSQLAWLPLDSSTLPWSLVSPVTALDIPTWPARCPFVKACRCSCQWRGSHELEKLGLPAWLSLLCPRDAKPWSSKGLVQFMPGVPASICGAQMVKIWLQPHPGT